MLEFENVSFSYPENSPTSSVIEEVSFFLQKNEKVALAGKNGSGKSTLGLLAAFLLFPTKGRVIMREEGAEFSHKFRKTGILFQNSEENIVGNTVEEDIAFGLENMGIPSVEINDRIDWICDRMGFSGRREEAVSRLSAGEKRKLSLASMLVLEPDLIILDEPTSLLDPWDKKAFFAILRKIQENREFSMIFITSDPEERKPFPRTLVLCESKLVYDGPTAKLEADPRFPSWGIAPSAEEAWFA